MRAWTKRRENWVSCREAASLIGVSLPRITQLCNEGKLARDSDGYGGVKISRESVERLIAAREEGRASEVIHRAERERMQARMKRERAAHREQVERERALYFELFGKQVSALERIADSLEAGRKRDVR